MNGHQEQREQSARMIEEALFKLMGEKDYKQITVSEIASRADVGRRTFYRIYKGKDEVLRSYISKLGRAYRGSHLPLECYDLRRIAREYFGFWYQYRDFLLLMHESDLDEMLYYEISCASTEVIRDRITDEQLKEDNAMGYFVNYSAGGFMLLLRRWVEAGMQAPPGQYAEAVCDALLKYMGKEGPGEKHES